ncbi:MAG: YggU family protein [Hydrogenophilales bacterium 28-61-23]|nr:MAG: YggU family protein [Hydrogenophilales bacterium 28-61-23]
MTPWIKSADGGTELSIHIQPGASKSEIAGLHGDAIKIRIKARPVEGAANAALTEFVATCLGVPRQAVRILRGEKSRRKSVWVAMQADEAERQLLGIMG